MSTSDVENKNGIDKAKLRAWLIKMIKDEVGNVLTDETAVVDLSKAWTMTQIKRVDQKIDELSRMIDLLFEKVRALDSILNSK